jgi:hypothetical protein
MVLGDNEPITFGDAPDASMKFNATNTVIATAGALIAQINGTTEGLKISAAGEVTTPLNPSFLTQGSGINGVTGDGSVYTLLFGTEKFDIGSNLSGATFTAPVSGIYHFMGSVETRDAVDGTNNDGSITLVTTARSYTVVRGDWGAMSMTGGIESCVRSWSTLANLDAGDTAHVTLAVSGGAKIVDIEASGLFFSGRLVG